MSSRITRQYGRDRMCAGDGDDWDANRISFRTIGLGLVCVGCKIIGVMKQCVLKRELQGREMLTS